MSLLHIFSISKEFSHKQHSRYNINGVRVECNANSLKAIATNGHILSVLECNNFENTNNLPSGNYTITLDAIKTIEKVLKADANADISKYIQKVDADFPAHERVMPKHFKLENESVYFEPDYLVILSKACQSFLKAFKCTDEAVKITFFGATAPALYEMKGENYKLTCVIMPRKR